MPLALTDQSTLADVRKALGDVARHAIELRNTPADKRGETFEADVRSALDDIRFGDAIEQALAAEQRAAEAAQRAEREAAGPSSWLDEAESRTISAGREFVRAPGYEEFAQRGGRGSFEVEVRTLLSETTGDTSTGTGVNVLLPAGTPYFKPGPLQQRLFVRDLLGAQPTGLHSVPYIQEKNAITNEGGALMTSEGSAKAEVTMEFQDADAPVRKITAWIPVTTEILADAPTLRGYIDNRLGYMLALREEQQILKGNGTPPQIRGITETSDTQVITNSGEGQVAGDIPGTLAAAYAKIENVDGNVTGVVMNPIDYWKAVATRHATQFDNGFGGNAPAEMASVSWGQPVIRSRSLTANECLVGDWRGGASLFQRQGITIRASDSHDDYFIKNKVAILAEERVALAVEHPPFFVEVTLDFTPPGN